MTNKSLTGVSHMQSDRPCNVVLAKLVLQLQCSIPCIALEGILALLYTDCVLLLGHNSQQKLQNCLPSRVPSNLAPKKEKGRALSAVCAQ